MGNLYRTSGRVFSNAIQIMFYQTNRLSAERDARKWSIDDSSAWLVVDTGTINVPEYRVWREQTIQESPPDFSFEIVSRAAGGVIEHLS